MFEISLFSLFILRFLCRRRQFCRLLPLKSFSYRDGGLLIYLLFTASFLPAVGPRARAAPYPHPPAPLRVSRSPPGALSAAAAARLAVRRPARYKVESRRRRHFRLVRGILLAVACPAALLSPAFDVSCRLVFPSDPRLALG